MARFCISALTIRRAVACAGLLLSMACTGAVSSLDEWPCSTSATRLTYENFGRDFLTRYCQRCHGQSGTGRHGAPPEYDFHDVEHVRALKERIFARAAGDNTSMPPGPEDPPRLERKELADWLACGAK